MRTVVPVLSAGLIAFAAFVFNYPILWERSDHLLANADAVLNFSQMVDGARWFLGETGDRSFWDFGIFYPLATTKALSDHHILPSFLLAGMHQLGIDWLQGHNLLSMLHYCLNAVCFCWFMIRIGTRPVVAILIAVFFSIGQYRTVHFHQIQLLPTFWWPLILGGIWSYWERPRIRYVVGSCAALLGLALTSPYLLVFMEPLLVILAVFIIWRESSRFSWRRILIIGAITATTLGSIYAVYQPYQKAREDYGLVRTNEERSLYSFRSSGFDSGAHLRYDSPVLKLREAGPESEAFITATWRYVFFLAILAAFWGWLWHGRQGRWQLMGVCFCGALLYLGIAYGPEGHKGIKLWAFAEKLPGFDGLRSPARMIIVFQMLTAILTGLFLDCLPISRKIWAWGLCGLLIGTHVVESAPPHLGHRLGWSDPQAVVNDLIADAGTATGDLPVLYFAHHDSDQFMLFTAASRRIRLVNGSSGYTPVSIEHYILPNLIDVYQHNSIDLLKRLGIRYVVIDRQKTSSEVLQFFTEAPTDIVTKVSQQGRFSAFRIHNANYVTPLNLQGDRSFWNAMGAESFTGCHRDYQLRASHHNAYLHQMDGSDNSNNWTMWHHEQGQRWIEFTLARPRLQKTVVLLKSPQPTAPRNFSRRIYETSYMRRIKVIDEQGQPLKFSNRIGFNDRDGIFQAIEVFSEGKPLQTIRIIARKSPWVDLTWRLTDGQICNGIQ